MKKKTIIGILGIAVIGILIMSHSDGPLYNSSLLTVTGAPGENTCNFCHIDFPENSGPGSLVLLVGSGVAKYKPDSTYNLTITVTGSFIDKYGFQMTARKLSDNGRAGTFLPISTADTFLINGRQYIEHNQSVASGVWVFPWKAPSNNVGDIIFYLTATTADFPTGSQNDHTYATTLTINGPVTPAADFVVSDNELCAGEEIQFESLSVNATSLLWSFQGGSPASSTGIMPFITYVTTGTYDVQLIATNSFGSDTMLMQQYIDVFPAPDLALNKQDISCFSEDDGIITSMATGGTPSYVYQWTTGPTTPDITGLDEGIYCLTVSDAMGCEAEKCDTINEPTELIVSGQVTHSSGSNGEIALTASGGVPPYSYQWSNSDTTKDISGLAPDIYIVTVTDSTGCTKLDSFEVEMIVGMISIDNDSQIEAYYFAASKTLRITADHNISGKTRLTIYNILGRKLYHSEMDAVNLDGLDVNLNNLLQGYYLVHFQMKNSEKTVAFVVQ